MDDFARKTAQGMPPELFHRAIVNAVGCASLPAVYTLFSCCLSIVIPGFQAFPANLIASPSIFARGGFRREV